MLLCVFHVGDNKGDIGEEHKKDMGHTRCYIPIVFYSSVPDGTLFCLLLCPHLSFVGSLGFQCRVLFSFFILLYARFLGFLPSRLEFCC